MPAIYFKCPSEQTELITPITDCLEMCPRSEGRCLSLPTLTEIGRTREWTGKPSTTQLLNPTRLEWLKIKRDYIIAPSDTAFALLGSRHHWMLEAVAKTIEGLIAEKKLGEEDAATNTGILDLLEPDELNRGFWKLTDYKTWGAYSVAKIMGIKDNGEFDLHQLKLQLNDYRIKAESLRFPISRLFVQCTVRDGGTYSAKNMGVDFKICLVQIDKMPDDEVIEYFQDKAQTLLEAIESDAMPPLCDYEGRWGNRRCKGFCQVMPFCPEGAAMNKMEFKES